MQRWAEWVPCGCPSYCLQATKALFSSLPIRRKLERKPIARPRASSKIDFPEPVSPLKTQSPDENSISVLSIKTMFWIERNLSTCRKFVKYV